MSQRNKKEMKTLASASHDPGAHLTTSDGGHRITMQGSRKASKEASNMAIALLCIVYGLSSAGLTFSSKKVYVMYGEICPMNLLMAQSLLNVAVCLSLMILRELNIVSFNSFKKYGLVIPKLNKLGSKFFVGIKVGLAGLFTVVLGQYAMKYSPLPL